MNRGELLLHLARSAIAERLGIAVPQPTQLAEAWLLEEQATFVSLHLGGELRGCIGSLTARQPLLEDLRANAVAAAFHDPRFPPLDADEFEAIEIEVSLLSPPEELRFHSEAEALAQLSPGKDGVILEYGSRRATFLPQVWRQLPAPPIFLSQLKRKAGLTGDFWHSGLRLWRYRVERFAENEGRDRGEAP